MAAEPGIRFHRHSFHWRRRLRWLGVLLVVAGLSAWWFGLGRPQQGAGAAGMAAPRAQAQPGAASGAATGPFWSLAREAEGRVLAEHYRRAGVPTATPPPGSRIDAAEWEARRRDARWCAEGGARWDGGDEPPPALADLRAAQQQMVRAWARQLRQRADIQAQVAAEWLDISHPTDAASAARARARLQDLARSSRQPVAVYLALHMGCADAAACTPVPASLWAELEPDNRQAWLAQLGWAEAPAAQRDWLARAVLAPQHIDYSRELLKTLQTLPREVQPGLRRAAQQAVWAAAAFGVSPQYSGAPLRLCKSSEAKLDSALHEQCRMLAQQLWRDGEDVLSHSMALSLAKVVDADNPQWTERRAEQRRMHASFPGDPETLQREHGGQALECLIPDVIGQMLDDMASKGEWGMLQAHVEKIGAAARRAEPLQR